MRYRKRPEAENEDIPTYHAALYRPGESLDELTRVARQAASDAMVVEVPQLRIALVHYYVAPMGYPDEQYEPVKAHRYLVYSTHGDYLFTMDEATFNRKYELYEE